MKKYLQRRVDFWFASLDEKGNRLHSLRKEFASLRANPFLKGRTPLKRGTKLKTAELLTWKYTHLIEVIWKYGCYWNHVLMTTSLYDV